MQSANLNPIRLLLKGIDVLDLLHRITTLNFKSLSLNQSKQGLILNPQGKIECGFWVEKKSSDEVEVLADDKIFQEILDRYTFGEQYKITELPAMPTAQQNEFARISAMQPKPGKEYFLNGQTNPLEINLQSAIDDQKGCYPGQEVIEKIIALGSPARKLCLVSTYTKSSMTLPTTLLSNGQEIGLLTSFDNNFGLAIMKRTHAKENIEVSTSENQTFKIEKVSS